MCKINIACIPKHLERWEEYMGPQNYLQLLFQPQGGDWILEFSSVGTKAASQDFMFNMDLQLVQCCTM